MRVCSQSISASGLAWFGSACSVQSPLLTHQRNVWRLCIWLLDGLTWYKWFQAGHQTAVLQPSRGKLGIHLRQRQAEAWRRILSKPPQTEEIFQFLRGVAHSVHTVHKEENSSSLPHFNLPTRDGSDRSSLWSMWLGSVRHLHQPRRGCHAAPRLASVSSVFPAVDE